MKRDLETELKKLKIIIVSHIFARGPALELEDYLKGKTSSLLFIGHPFLYRDDIRSFYRHYENGKLIKTSKVPAIKIPEILNYFKEFILTLWWIMIKGRKFDLYIGSDSFSAFMGFVLKKLSLVNYVILYTIDYLPQRFENRFLNSLYHFFDKVCLKNCTIVWNVSKEISEARSKFAGLKPEECVKQIVVPLGVWYNRIPKTPLSKRDQNTIVFMGHILEKQGLDEVIRALPIIKRKIPKIKLRVIGTGPHLSKLRALVTSFKVSNHVEFLGYVKSHKEIERILAKNMIAVATYKPDPKSFTYFADPGKVKNYLAAGLPVLITDVPPIAKEITKRKCALLCEYNPEDIAKKAISLLSNNKRVHTFSKNAVNYAKKYDWNKTYSKAFTRSFKEIH